MEAFMKAITLVLKQIAKIPRGTPFKATALYQFASYGNVRQILARLVKTQKLVRVTRGVYVKPEKNPYIGKVLPSAEEIVKVIAKNSGEQIAKNGAEAANLLGLSTQVPMRSIFLTSGNSRRIKIGNREVFLKHANPRKFIGANVPVTLVLNALWYLGKENVNISTIKSIREKLNASDYNTLINHTAQMPGWMVNKFFQFQKTINNHD
jgi:hypothetical protein